MESTFHLRGFRVVNLLKQGSGTDRVPRLVEERVVWDMSIKLPSRGEFQCVFLSVQFHRTAIVSRGRQTGSARGDAAVISGPT